MNRAPVILFGAFFILGSAFLFLRASDPRRWSQWAFGDAQTMMAASVFRDEGFLSNYFLWVPQPSSPVARFLDDEPVRHHAHGSAGEAKRSGLGPHRRYTHWPSWYSIPYGLMAKVGITQKSYYQWWAVSLSMGSLLFFFLFIRNLSNETIALASTILYWSSPAFLGFSDSLATMPYDDFFRFAFLWLWSRNTPMWICGLIYSAALLTALDSVLFIPIVALITKGVSEKRLPWSTAFGLMGFGLLAFGVQWIQNASYLGMDAAWRDWKGYFLDSGSTSLGLRLKVALFAFQDAFQLPFIPSLLAVALSIFISFRVRKELGGWSIALAAGGMAFSLLVPAKALMEYEARQTLPFAILGMASLVQLILARAPNLGEVQSSLLNATTSLLLAFGIFYHFQPSALKPSVDFPARSRIDPVRLAFFEGVKRAFPGHRVFFQMSPVVRTKPFEKEGFDQTHPIDEYYSEGIVFTVPDLAALARDLGYFWAKIPGQFRPFILVKGQNESLETIEAKLSGVAFPWTALRAFRENDIIAVELSPRMVGDTNA